MSSLLTASYLFIFYLQYAPMADAPQKWTNIFTRENFFKTGERVNNTVETLDQTFSGKTITDLSFSYTINKTVTVNIGANNLFDVYPDEQAHYNNTSTGRFTYSRSVSQFGYNGRYLFGKITLNL